MAHEMPERKYIMGLDMYLFKTKKNQLSNLVTSIRDAVEADTTVFPSIGGYHLVPLDENERNHVDKLGPVVSWVKVYDIHNWFSQNVLGNKQGNEERQLALVTRRQLQSLLEWCDERMTGLSLANIEQARLHSELKRTQNEIQKLMSTTDFSRSIILYFAYW